MKKIFFFILFFFPFVIFADYSITNYKIDITVLENGDVEVIETINMNGDYNGFERIINYKRKYDDYIGSKILSVDADFYNIKKLELLEIRAINFFNDDLINNSYLFERVDKAAKGEYGVYTIHKSYNGETYKIYNPSQMNKDFYIKYKLKNMVIVHDDVCELLFNIFDKIEEKIDLLEVNIHIPNNKKNINVWVHGTNYEKNFIDNENISFKVNNLGDKKFFNFRTIFDVDVVENVNKKTDLSVYNKIIEIENKLENEQYDKKDENFKYDIYSLVSIAEKTKNRDDYEKAFLEVKKLQDDDFKTQLLVKLMNIESKVERKEIYLKIIFTSVMIIWIMISFIIVYNSTKNNSKDKQIDKLSYDYSPATLSYLLRKKITKTDLAISIYNLILKDKIEMIQTKSGYKLIKKSGDNLLPSEEKILKLLFENDEITLNSLSKKIKKNEEYYLNRYSNWLNCALIEANNENFYVDQLLIKTIGIVNSIVGIILGALLLKTSTYFSPFIVIALAIILIVYFLLVSKKTSKGIVHYAKWIKEKNKLDEKMLAYSIVLGNRVNNKEYNVINKFVSENF